jgi:Zn-dependent protease/predicted transcriptional regulator
MRWSWKIAEFAGIGVYVHATFTLLIGWVVLVHWTQGQSLAASIAGVAFILTLFACVVLHEFGHALTAKKFGIATKDITLLPIGGVARLERMPEEPRQELWVALAGPAVNVGIAAVLYLWLLLTGGWQPVNELSITSGPFVERLLVVNVFLVLFNMLPAFPMDGGRVLRALLATRMEYTRATQIAATLGQGMAFLFGFLGFFSNPFLLFIALFVWMGAEQEASMVQMRSALGGIPVTHAMQTHFRTLGPRDPLERAVELILSGSQQDLPVLEDGRVVGILTRADLLAALAQKPAAIVGETMQRDFQTVDPGDMLETAFRRLQGCQCHTLAVVRRGELVGLVTADNVGEFIMIQGALQKSKRDVRKSWSLT